MSIQEEVNFMSGRNDGHFNSTMKSSSGHWNNSPNRNNSYNGDRNNSYYGGRNNSYQGKNNSYSDNRSDRNNPDSRNWNNRSWNPRYNYSDNYDSKRRLNRYRHQPRDPKNNIRFEYNTKRYRHILYPEEHSGSTEGTPSGRPVQIQEDVPKGHRT